MKERPILFQGPMVRAILEGRKTQTRRLCKTRTQNQTDIIAGALVQDMAGADDGTHEGEAWKRFPCPYGQPGDRLWVRETWAVNECYDGRPGNGCGPVPEVAVECRVCPDAVQVLPGRAHRSIGAERGRWRPSIHMPRWASRILLEVVAVRVERLNDISAEDARAEGVEVSSVWPHSFVDYQDDDGWFAHPVGSYHSLWKSINGPESWATNPWVWVVEFKRVEVKA